MKKNAFEIIKSMNEAAEQYAGMDISGEMDIARYHAFVQGALFMLKELNTPST
jgi:hypothetical protein